MSSFSRTIHIGSENLGGTKPATILLTFDKQPNMDGMYTDYYPVVRKVSEFPTEGFYALTTTFINQLVFINPQVENNTISSAATWVDINPGQQTELIEGPNSVTKSFTHPKIGVMDKIKATNNTETLQTIGVGFNNGGFPPPTLLVYKNVGSTRSVTAEFAPIVRAYIISGYKENSVIKEEIQSPVIWTMNLAPLEPTTWWNLIYDEASGRYSIISVEPPPPLPPI